MKRLSVTFASILMLLAGPALAERGGNGGSRGEHEGRGDGGGRFGVAPVPVAGTGLAAFVLIAGSVGVIYLRRRRDRP